MSIFDALQPNILWKFFEQILKIPRTSGNETGMRDHLIKFALENKLEWKVDQTGNLLIIKPAKKGREAVQTVVLQSHLDMVGEKNSDHSHNFLTDPILAQLDGGWIKAMGTTLGADDGIGIAAQMAILSATHLDLGKIECLFTVEEETGLTGAFGIEPGFFDGKILINLDSEDEGELFIGCAGGIDTTAWFDFSRMEINSMNQGWAISVTGLTGGHSGDDIHKELGNANKILARLLLDISNNHEIFIHHFDGGNLRNAIPREAIAVVSIKKNLSDQLEVEISEFAKKIKQEFIRTEPGLKISMHPEKTPEWAIDKDTQNNLIRALIACPHGVISWSQTMTNMVESSTNLASVKFSDNRIKVTTSQRSSLTSAKQYVAAMVESAMKLAGAEIYKSTGYPGWNPNPDSEILKITKKSYERLFHESPVVRSIHAGLECGLFLEKYPYLDMVSFGPTIKGAHSPDERINIESTDKFWKLLIDVLTQIT